MRIVLIVVVVLFLLLCLISFLLSGFSMGIKRQTLEDARKWQEEHYDLSWYDELKKSDYTVSSYDGYQLHVQYLENPKETDKFILISHGYTDNRFGALKYAKMYLDLGFNVIVYDLRGHGENEPTFCTYSIRESQDLHVLISDCRKRWPQMSQFGVHGESLGAASSIAVLQYKPQIDFVVADCGFSQIIPVLQVGLSSMKLPTWLVYAASAAAKVRYGYSFSEMRPIDSLKDNQIPILFIHGAADDFIVPEHSVKMKNATAGYSEICLIPNAGHAMSILTGREKYVQAVKEFLQKIG